MATPPSPLAEAPDDDGRGGVPSATGAAFGSTSSDVGAAPNGVVPPLEQVSFLRFNQDVTSLAVATVGGGYKLFSLTSLDSLECVNSKKLDVDNAVVVVERLFSSSLVALVQKSSPKKLRVCHFKKGTEICNYSYSSPVLAVRLNRARLVVCLEESLYIHNIRDMKIMHTIKDTPPNPGGVCALSTDSDRCYLAYPGSATTGEVQVFDAFNLTAAGMIPAHDGPLAALAFSPDGSRLATASEKGTVIRIFNVEDGAKLVDFRRGVKRCALVNSLCFSPDARYLALGSNTETIHVFRLPDEVLQQQQQQKQEDKHSPTSQKPEDDSMWGYFNSAVSLGASMLPAQVTETLSQARAYTTLTVPKSRCDGARDLFPNQVALGVIGRRLRILLATSDGYLYVYDLPGAEGGECVLVKQHFLAMDFAGGPEGGPEGSLPTAIANPSSASPSRGSPVAGGSSGSPAKGWSPAAAAVRAGEDDPNDVSVEEVDADGPAVLTVRNQGSHRAASGGPDPEGAPFSIGGRGHDGAGEEEDEDEEEQLGHTPPPVQRMPVKPPE